MIEKIILVMLNVILNYKRLCPSVCVSVTSFHNFSAVTDLNF